MKAELTNIGGAIARYILMWTSLRLLRLARQGMEGDFSQLFLPAGTTRYSTIQFLQRPSRGDPGPCLDRLWRTSFKTITSAFLLGRSVFGLPAVFFADFFVALAFFADLR